MDVHRLGTANPQVVDEAPRPHHTTSDLHSMLYSGDQARHPSQPLIPPGPHWSGHFDVAVQLDAQSQTSTTPSNKARRASAKSARIGEQDASDSNPPWTEMKTKAGKERKRLPLACIACRRKKIRCSGEKPACKHCLKSRTPCVYKLSARKVGPRTDYMAMLDKRLKRMEDRVIKIIPKEEFDSVPDVSRAVVRPSASQQQVRLENRKRSAGEAFRPDLDEWAKAKPSRETGRGEAFGVPRARTHNPDEPSLLLDGKEHLPSQEIQEHLAETYFDYVYGQSYHLLHKPSFMRKLSAGTVPPVLLLAVCAMSARFSNHPKLNSEPAFLRGEQWSDAAREIALRRFDTPNVTILTVFVILGLHEFGTCQGGRSWMLGGMAIRMAYALQLHKDLSEDPTTAQSKGDKELCFTDREIRRRTMWACFIMDRFNSSGMQRPMFSSEESLELQLPVKEQYFLQEIPASTEALHLPRTASDAEKALARTNRDNMGVAAYMIRIVALFGRIIQYVNLGGLERDTVPLQSSKSGYMQLLDQVEDFSAALPDSLQITDENLRIHEADHTANQYLYLHVVYNGCVLFLNRVNSPGGAKALLDTMSNQFRREARAKAISAATSISQLLTKASHHRAVAPFAGYCAYTASLVHIHAIFSRDKGVAETSKQYLRTNISYLHDMKKYWGNFHFLVDNLRELWQNYADLASKGTTTPNPRLEAHQYGDWYDRYPNGVMQSDFQVPKSELVKERGEDAAMAEKTNTQSVEQFFAALSPESKARRLNSKTENSTGKSSKRRNSKNTGRKSSHQTSKMSRSPAEADFDTMDFGIKSSGFPESYDRSPVFSQQQQHQHQHQQHQHQHQHQSLAPPVQVSQSQTGLGNGHLHDAYSMQTMQSQAVPPLDGPLALPNYGEIDPQIAPDMMSNFWDMDFANVLGEEFMTEPQNAWFMPFNFPPPDFNSGAGNEGYIPGEQKAYMGDQSVPGQIDPNLPPNSSAMMDLSMRGYDGNGRR